MKPCPFCGSTKVEFEGIDTHAVFCHECGAAGPEIGYDPKDIRSEDQRRQDAERMWDERT